MRVSEAEARERLGPVLLAVARAIKAGDAVLRNPENLPSGLRSRLSASAIATMRQEIVVQEARQIINAFDYPGTRWTTVGGVHWLIVDDLAVCRFKQLDELLIPKNYPTEQAVAFADPQEPLPGTPPAAAKFVVGWRMDQFGRAVQARYVVQPNSGRQPPWLINLDEIDAESAPLPIRPLDPTGLPPRIVRAKRAAERALGVTAP